MGSIKSHQDLIVYQESLDFALDIYKISKVFPAEEKYGLTSQIRRAAVSIPSNIAEGAARESQKEFCRFLYIALGSLAEVETQMEIASRLDYLSSNEELDKRAVFIRRMLLKLIKTLK